MKAQPWGGAVDGPGLYLGVPTADYRADPCPAPSLNSSTARVALRSLKKAKAIHPRLTTPLVEDDEDEEPAKISRAMDIGSAAHSLAFGFGAQVAVIEAKNWRTKEAQKARDAARSIGEIPVLRKELKIAQAMAEVARPVLTDLLDGSLVAEAMIVSRDEHGFWYRGLVDRARADMRVIIDYKTTAMEASPSAAMKAVYTAVGAPYFQEAFYRRILNALDPDGAGRRRFCFLYQEQEPPFEITLVETSEAGRSLGEEQVEGAIALWQRAMKTGEWPGYPLGPHLASPPPWLIESWARRAEVDETLNTPFPAVFGRPSSSEHYELS